MKQIWSKSLACLLCLALLVGMLPVAALAEDPEISYIDAEGSTKTCLRATVVDSTSNTWTGSDPGGGWYVVNSNVTIDQRVTVTGEVHLILANGCKLTASQGINVTGGNSLTIYAQSENENTMGKLDATAPNDEGANAAIGGNQNETAGTITINGGKITAKNEASPDPWLTDIHGAAIGGGGSGGSGTITINGGIVNATTARNGDGAGIGSGENAASGSITITGGVVYAASNGAGAGIGGGYCGSDYKGNQNISITISGGTVTAFAGYQSAAIGAGRNDNKSNVYQGTFSTGENGNAVIFTGCRSSEENDLKNVLASISKFDSDSASGVIFIFKESDASTTGSHAGKVYGSVTPTEDFIIPENYTLTIKDGQTLTISEDITLTNNGTIVNNGTINGKVSGNIVVDTYYLDTDNETQNKRANLVTNTSTAWGTADSGDEHWYVVQDDVTIGQRVTVTGDVHLILADGCKLTASQGINVTGDNSLTIYAQSTGADMGALTANAENLDISPSQAGIGGNDNQPGGTITINGGAVTANGGDYASGIGGGSDGGAGGNITITGGTVKANGNYGGAGIGGGYYGSGGTIIISGGTVTANGGDYHGAGIGGGFGGAGGTITISGGAVTATGNGHGAGIGGGSADGGEITITGGTVIASGNGAGIGNGLPAGDDNGTFSTEANGRAVIIASRIGDQSKKENWSGVIFQGKTGAVYGANIAPIEDFTIPEEYELTIEEGQTLTISQGITLTNKGTIIVNDGGALVNQGTITGNGKIQLNGGSTVQTGDGPEITVGEDTTGTTADKDGSVTLPENGSATIGSGDNTTTITTPDGGTIDPDTGAVTPDKGGSVVIGSGDDTTTITPPDDQPVTPNGDGSVTIPGGSTVQIGDGESITIPSGGDTLLPDGSLENYTVTVTFDSQGGSAVASQTVAVGTAVTRPANPARNGYSFQGWYTADGDTQWDFANSVTGNMTLFARWTQNSSGGGGGSTSRPTYPPAMDEPENGAVTTSPSRPEEGDAVTITPKPDEGFEVDEILVKDEDGKEIKVTQNPDGTYTFTQPDGKVTITVTFRCDGGELCPGHHLTDVSKDAWYHAAVDYAVAHGIMEGMSDTTFSPNTEVTRAQAVQILYNLEGKPGLSDENLGYPYEDVNAEEWYGNAVYWARITGVATGYGDGTFQPTDSITRQEFAQMLYNYAKYKGYDLTAEGDLSQFPDSNTVADWAEAAMSWANGNELINGHDDGTIDAAGIGTRAQAASILMRFDENVTE